MDIGGTIRRFRLLNGMEQKELAKLLHVSDKTVSSWETNRTQPKMEMIEELCKIFHCQKSDFLEEIPISFETSEDYIEWIIPSGKNGTHDINLNDNEYALITGYRMLKESDKTIIARLIRIMAYAKLLKREI